MVPDWQLQLTYGLSFLFELEVSRGYEHRLRILQSKGFPRTTVALAVHLQRAVPTQFDHHRFTWHTSLANAISWAPWYINITDSWDPESRHEKDLIKEWPGAHDPVDATDSALFRVWLEAHKEISANHMSYCPESQYLRKCGYVMWDTAVPWSMDLGFDPELQNRIRDGKQRALIENIERQRGLDQMRRSWKERAAIREQGGRGYWEPGQCTED